MGYSGVRGKLIYEKNLSLAYAEEPKVIYIFLCVCSATPVYLAWIKYVSWSSTALRRSPSTSGLTSLISAVEKANMMYVSRNNYCAYDVDNEYDETLGKAPERYW